jgi:hypothetical protein
MKMEKWVLLKLFQELGVIKENGGGGELNYNIFDYIYLSIYIYIYIDR